MKKTLPLLFAAACGAQLMAPLDVAAQDDDGKDPARYFAGPLPAVIVIRHGEDIQDRTWPTDKADVKTWSENWAPRWPKYELPNRQEVEVHSHGLSSLGEKQAAWLATNLPALLQGQNFMPVTRVITKDPYTHNEKNQPPTPNPFDTAWPFIKTKGITDVMLIKARTGTNDFGPRAGKINETVDKGLLYMLPCYNDPDNFQNAKPYDSILPTNAIGQITGSTLIVWDGQGMWGPHDGPWYWADDTEQKTEKLFSVVGANILRLLGGTVIGNEILNRWDDGGGGMPLKAKRLYLFYPRFGTGPFWTEKAPVANGNHVQLYGKNVPQYDLMVWDIPTDNQKGPLGWKNMLNITGNEEERSEQIYNH